MKTTIITGGSSGLGLELAKQLVSKRHLILIGRNLDKLRAAEVELKELNVNAKIDLLTLDIADAKGEEEKISTLGVIDELLNVAGVGIFKEVIDYSVDEIQAVVNTNLLGSIYMTIEVLKKMKSGWLVNVISTAGLRGKKGESVYCASKFGLRGYTEALKATYKGTDIKVMAVYPGGMKTPFWSSKKDEFMSPTSIAKKIVDAMHSTDNAVVSDLVIERW